MLTDLGSIPGFVPEPERGYAYVLALSAQDIRQFMRGMKYQPGARKPSYGTMRYVEKVLTTPEGDYYFAVSLNGDSEGWRAALQAYADSKAVIMGKLVGEYLEVAGAKRIPLRDCSVASTWDDR